MNKQIVFWTTVIVLAIAGLYALSIGAPAGLYPLSNRAPSGSPAQNLPDYSLSPGAIGMISGGAGYGYDYYSTTGPVPTEDLVAEVQRYLDRLGNPELTVARLRELTRAYQAEVIERSTGRHAFDLMLGKGTRQVSPTAGPNLFWNTKYGPEIAEVGGGYGMLGRLLPRGSMSDMSLTESEARRIAEQAVNDLGADLKLDDEAATFYGFYQFHVIWEGELVGELDVNGYSGQTWYNGWGEPQLSVQDLTSGQAS